jgi:hypothetical protein
MESGVRAAWARLSVPAKPNEQSASHIPGTNAWVFKDYRNGFGLLLTGVSPPARELRFQHLRVKYFDSKIIEEEGKARDVPRCVQLFLDPECSGESLATILDRLASRAPSGRYGTEDLTTVLDEAAELFILQTPSASKESVIGAWGELYFIETLMARAKDTDGQTSILRAWEAEGSQRDIVDFRFEPARLLVEVKTFISERIHHFSGLRQVTVPNGWTEGYVASVKIREVHGGLGRTCADLCEGLLNSALARGVERDRFSELLDSKLTRRGMETRDRRFRFQTEDSPISVSKMPDVPKPTSTSDIINLEWTANLSEAPSLSGADVRALLDLAAG